MGPVHCYLCDKSFKSVNEWNGHKKAHITMCPYCGRKFASRFGVYGHLKVHNINVAELEAVTDNASDTSDTDNSASGESLDMDEHSSNTEETPSTTCSGDESSVSLIDDASQASDVTLYHARPPPSLEAVFNERDKKKLEASLKFHAENGAKLLAKHAKRMALGKCEPGENEIDVYEDIDESSSNQDSEESEELSSSFISLAVSEDENRGAGLRIVQQAARRYYEAIDTATHERKVIEWLKETGNKKRKRAESSDDANSDHDQPSTSTGKKARF